MKKNIFLNVLLLTSVIFALPTTAFADVPNCDEVSWAFDYEVSTTPSGAQFAYLSDAMSLAEAEGDRDLDGVVRICVNSGKYQDNVTINMNKWSPLNGHGNEPIEIIAPGGFKATEFNQFYTDESIIVINDDHLPVIVRRPILFKGITFAKSEKSAMQLIARRAELTLENVRFTENESDYAAALFMDIFTRVNIMNSTFDNNISFLDTNEQDQVEVGNIVFLKGSKVYIHNSKFEDNINHGSRGGAIFGTGNNSTSELYGTYDEGPIFKLVEEQPSTADVDEYPQSITEFQAINSSFKNNQITPNGYVSGSGAGASLMSLTNILIDNCEFKMNQATPAGVGGALRIYFSDTVITNSIFEENSAGDGGALDISSLNTSITNSVFNGNTASHNGGAIKASGARQSIFTLDNLTFTRNQANEHGGALKGTNLRLSRSIFDNNQAGVGGAVSLSGGLSEGETISKSIFKNNRAVYGGAVHGFDIDAKVLIEETDFENNTAEIHGGALYLVNVGYDSFLNYFRGEILFDKVNGWNNSAGEYGGFIVALTSRLRTVNTHLYDNTAGTIGGAGYIEESIFDGVSSLFTFNTAPYASAFGVDSSSIDFYNSTIAGNNAVGHKVAPEDTYAVKLYDTSQLNIFDSIFGFNYGHNVSYTELFGSTISMEYTDFYEEEGITSQEEVDNAFNSSNTNIDEDPEFKDGDPSSTSIGHGVFDFDLQPSSPAIGTATGGVDMGAYGNGVW